ncbi:transmembrane protein 272-like isoform X2 [Rhodnius prolixus]|uniref:transmembrane protein 272-like isoform X2 n=1 Tax=Rhodnius prolixus TaxID=13249 RepID=UPI003D18AF37
MEMPSQNPTLHLHEQQQRAAPPPTYESVIGRVREVHKESSGTLDFIKKIILLLAGTVGCTILIAVTIVIPIAMMIVGGMYLSDCPVNNNIPLYLLVGGFFGILKQILQLYCRIKRGHNRNANNEEERAERTSTVQSLLSCFMFIWFILGSYWVYSEYKPNFEPKRGTYCNRTVYLFAFWQITVIYIVFIMMTLCLCSVSLCVIACARNLRFTEDRESQPIQE